MLDEESLRNRPPNELPSLDGVGINSTEQDLILQSGFMSNQGFGLNFDTVVDVNDFDLQNLDDIQLDETYLNWIGSNFLSYADLSVDDHQEDSSSLALNALATNLANLQINIQSGETFYVGPTSNRHLIQRPPESFPPPLIPSPPNIADIDTEVTISLSNEQKNFILGLFLRKIQPIIPVFDDDCFPSQPEELPPILRYAVLAVAAYVAGSDFTEEMGFNPRDIVTFYKKKFTYIIGSEFEQCRLDNIKAFVLRTYLAVLQGHLESANIFLGTD
jgi:hypothetical protein